MSQLATKQTEIGDCVYTMQKLPARVGVRTAAVLMNALAPSLKALPAEGFKIESEERLAAILQPLFGNPELGETVDRLCMTFSQVTTVTYQNGTTQPLQRVFDDHFADRYDDMMVWLGKSIGWSLSSFLRGVPALVALGASLVDKSASKSPSSPERTGQSGE